MTSTVRRSTLQIQILADLSGGSVDSITALAERLGSSRPSVSRSLHRLKLDHLVEQEGRSWSITEIGRREADVGVGKLREAMKDTVEIAGKKFRAASRLSDRAMVDTPMTGAAQIMSDHLASLNRIALGDYPALDIVPNRLGLAATAVLPMGLAEMVATLGDSPAMRVIDSPVLGLGEAASAALGLQGINGLAQSMSGLHDVSALATLPNALALANPIMEAQQSYSSILASLSAYGSDISLAGVADQSALLSATLSDALHFSAADVAATLALHPVEMSEALLEVPSHLLQISESLQSVFMGEVAGLSMLGDYVDGSIVSDRLLYATNPVAHYAHASRYLYDDEIDESGLRHPTSAEDMGNEDLDPLLERLDPDLVGKRRGSWMALNGSNPDRLAHAAGSQKNLLLQMLRLLVPDADLPETEDRPGSKIKARIKQIMGGSDSEAEHVKHVANAVFSGYSIYNKYDHTNQKNELALRAHMRTGEDLLFMILVRLES